VLRRLIEAFDRTGAAAAIALEEVEPQEVSRYGIAELADAIKGFDGQVFRISDLIEKPDPAEAPSRLAIAGRYVVAPSLFDALRRTGPGKGGEIQLTDALRIMLDEGKTLIGLRMKPGDSRVISAASSTSHSPTRNTPQPSARPSPTNSATKTSSERALTTETTETGTKGERVPCQACLGHRHENPRLPITNKLRWGELEGPRVGD